MRGKLICQESHRTGEGFTNNSPMQAPAAAEQIDVTSIAGSNGYGDLIGGREDCVERVQAHRVRQGPKERLRGDHGDPVCCCLHGFGIQQSGSTWIKKDNFS